MSAMDEREEVENETTEITVKDNRHTFPQCRTDETPETARKILSEVVQWMKMPKVETDDECAERLEYFFKKCFENGERPTVEKMCLALGTTRQTVSRWENGENGSARRRDIIQRAKLALAAYDAGLAITGKMNPVPYIFRAKNYYGMTDEQQVVITPNNPLGENTSAAEIAEKYAALPEE